ncbi:MAG: peptidoglycan DD-metalloendopeptidase family protein [Odoribacteraceae bacterium]|jgi:murein DD-endopeptidase MepM/ murein hydrolase activator NlpD|nr:peptidoglycan DD-metalloendopeptidase family protein [Odoribacteraceae bacterium]
MRREVIYSVVAVAAVIATAVILSRGDDGAVTGGDGDARDEVEESAAVAVSERRYGIAVDSFEVEEGVVARGETLSSLLGRGGVSAGKIAALPSRVAGVLDARGIRAGNRYALFLERDSARAPRYFVYERDAARYVVIDLAGEGAARAGEKEVVTVEGITRARITSSPWNDLKAAGADPVLALALADVYAWTVDFHGIRAGDSLSVIHERPFIDGRPAGRVEVKAAVFTRGGERRVAVRFPREGRAAYFDEQGNSLQKVFLKAPLRYSRVSSRFSNSRYHPVLKVHRPHHGVDYAAPAGTPVHAVGDGTVVKREYQAGGAGNFVTIRHANAYTTTYMHLSRFASGTRVGARVAQGEVIGYVGSTGLSTGPHLDFRMYRGGKPVDPLAVELPAGDPVAGEDMERFLLLKDSLVARLRGERVAGEAMAGGYPLPVDERTAARGDVAARAGEERLAATVAPGEAME